MKYTKFRHSSFLYCFIFFYRWNDSTLSDPFLASKTAWPVPHIESLFLPEFKINSLIQSEQFKVIDTISQGAFGKVYKVQRIDNGELFALKVLSKSQVNNFSFKFCNVLFFIKKLI